MTNFSTDADLLKWEPALLREIVLDHQCLTHGEGASSYTFSVVAAGGLFIASKVGFEYQEYLGFAEATYNTKWTATPTLKRTSPGRFRLDITDLTTGVEYQYRAVVKHPKLTVRGDHKQIKVR